MRHLTLVAVIALFGTACSSPEGKNNIPENNDACGAQACPGPAMLADCDLADPNCSEYCEGECVYRCLVDPTDEACLNAIQYTDCEPGYIEVETCPDGVTCETAPGCAPEYDRTCAPQTSFAAESFYTECDPGGCVPSVPSCEFDEDCALVPAGEVCDPCVDDCAVGAVLASDAQAYENEFASLVDQFCEMPEACSADCIARFAHCDLTTNTCTSREAKYITTEGAPKDCEVADDCAGVFAGEVCDACKCVNDAVRADFVGTYEEAFDVECSTNSQCRCDPPIVDCVDGLCVAMQ